MKISAVICTHNREQYLEKAIKSLLDQSLSKKDYEIIVIDNNSTDNTKEICKNKVKYFFESKQGLSYARNRGIKESKGKFIAFIDDDAIADKNWLKNIINAFKSNKELGCVCGKVEPIWGSKRPKWLTDKLLPMITILNWSEKPFFLKKEQWFVGTNMAFPKKLLNDIGFDTNLGRVGRSLLSGEEVYLREELEKRNLKSYYDPKVLVKHIVPKNRLNKRWFKKRFWWQGITNAIIQIKTENPSFIKKIKYSLAMSLPLIYNPKNWFGNFEKKCSNIGRLGYSYGIIFK